MDFGSSTTRRRSAAAALIGAVALAWPLAAAGNAFVRFTTALGSFDVELFDDDAPLTVANFLRYVRDGDYRDSFVHRSVPGFVIQGGGFTFRDVTEPVPRDAPVPNEFGRSNLRGTLAMAKVSGDPNSATSEWFFNLADNSGPPSELDTQNGGFTVFGQVRGDGMQVVDAIAALNRANVGQGFETLPLIDFAGEANFDPATQLVFVEVADVTSTRCEAAQLKAAAGLCKAELGCASKFAKSPAKDPTLAAVTACRDKGRTKFVQTYDKAVAGAARKEEVCEFEGPGSAVGAQLSDALLGLAQDMLAVSSLGDFSPGGKDEAALASGILKAAAGLCASEFGARAKDATKPDPEKLGLTLGKGRAKFSASSNKALAKAAPRGVDYEGRPLDEVTDAIVDRAESFPDP